MLARDALEALRQLGRYSVPRGAQTWECPVMQPDILAAAWAVRAYCEAHRLTGDTSHLAQARYWAWTGLPFLYTWELDGYPTMRYNAIAVMGSTFHTHSWIGLPVVWCGLVYAYALQDLAQYDDSFPWQRVAQGVTRSAMWQQYTDGPSKGCYPDSWHMVDNAPRPADINPEDILVNEFRLRGLSPEISHARVAREAGFAHLNSAARAVAVDGRIDAEGQRIRLDAGVGFPLYSLLAPVEEPNTVRSAANNQKLKRVGNSDELANTRSGWLYDTELEAVILKTTPSATTEMFRIVW